MGPPQLVASFICGKANPVYLHQSPVNTANESASEPTTSARHVMMILGKAFRRVCRLFVVQHMLSDPRKCREHAVKCLEIASHEKIEGSKQALLDIADAWMKLASDLERAETVSRNGNNPRGRLSWRPVSYLGFVPKRRSPVT
jgi:hypothetical protein